MMGVGQGRIAIVGFSLPLAIVSIGSEALGHGVQPLGDGVQPSGGAEGDMGHNSMMGVGVVGISRPLAIVSIAIVSIGSEALGGGVQPLGDGVQPGGGAEGDMGGHSSIAICSIVGVSIGQSHGHQACRDNETHHVASLPTVLNLHHIAQECLKHSHLHSTIQF